MCGADLREMTPKSRATADEIDNWTCAKLISLPSERYIKKEKIRPREWEKISSNHIFNKGLILRI